MPQTFVLIHSPLVGPMTWNRVAEDLRRRGYVAVVPSLHDAGCGSVAFWQRHVDSVSTALRGVPLEQHLVLVAHSGTGPLLPAIGNAVAQPVAACVFVDAALPGGDGQSRLDLFDEREAAQFRAAATGGMIPAVWRGDSLLWSTGMDDAELRHMFAAEVPDVPLAVYEEPLPVPGGWPDAPCGYLRFSNLYEHEAQKALSLAWPVYELTGGHFHMLVNPLAVTDALLSLVSELVP